MTTYYVRKTGSDSNNGTSAATAWATFGKLLGASGMASGDTAYVGAGIYRETVTVNLTAPTVETKILGDTDGSQTGDAGDVRLTNYTTNDTTSPAGATLLNGNNRPWLTFQGITFHVGGFPAVVALGTGHDWTFRACMLSIMRPGTSSFGVTHTTTAGNASNVLFDRCLILSDDPGPFLDVTAALNTADYDCAITLRNCLCLYAEGRLARCVGTTGSGTGKPGGIRFDHCTAWGASNLLFVQSATTATSIPCTVKGCVVATASAVSLQADTTGQITEDYNRFLSGNPRSNVAVGTHSVSDSSQAALLHLGQEVLRGAAPRPPFTPLAGSPLLGFGDDGTAPSVDLLNRPRPAGGVSASKAVGALERHDTGTQASSPVHGTTTHSLQLAGPADHEFLLPVDAVAQTPSIWAQYDANYGGGTLPQAVLTNGGQVGVADQTLTMTAVGSGTWQQLTFSSFTPTAKGYVTIRLVSSAAATGNAYFGDASP